MLKYEKELLLDGHPQDWRIYEDVDFDTFRMDWRVGLPRGYQPDQAKRWYIKTYEELVLARATEK